jgi:uncharacterized protein (DUF1684 family)
MRTFTFLFIFGLTIPLFSQTAKVTPEYRQSYEKWKTELVADLKENWLPLAGLFWLKPGENAFGSDQRVPVALPAGSCPEQAGVFVLQGKDVTVKFASGVQAKIDGKDASEGKLAPDVSGKASIVELGSLRMKVILRGDRVGIRVKDLNSAAVKDYKGPILYPLHAQYRITADWIPSDGKKTVPVPNVLGDVIPTPVAGEARFKLNGQEFRLEALGGDATKGLFFIFKDLTSKTDTYPPGRFLDTEAVKDNKVVLDFNEAYNPPCAVTPYATCPLPPKENQLAVAIPAGEKYDRKSGHH